jgi:hypothetical protein
MKARQMNRMNTKGATADSSVRDIRVKGENTEADSTVRALKQGSIALLSFQFCLWPPTKPGNTLKRLALLSKR